MSNVDRMREEARQLLDECRFVIGYERGSFTHLDRAVFVSDPADVDGMVFGPTSIPNLVSPAVDEFRKPLARGEKPDTRPIGIVCKGCDARAIVELVREHIIRRDMVRVIGMPCQGVIDIRKFKECYGEVNDVMGVTWGPEGGFLVDGQPPDVDLLADKCRHCSARNPTVTDVRGMEPVEQPEPAGYDDVDLIEGMEPEDRWELFRGHFDNCIRCYACREVCPMCYCTQCSIDISKPFSWAEKFDSISDNTYYHVMRAMHLAGRCVDCGECERVCPVDIPLRLLNRKLVKCAQDNFGIVAGEQEDRPSLLGGGGPGDKEGFIW